MCRWETLKDQALQQPLKDSSAAYRAIREMLAKGTSDPYTRFITPEEFESMRKYDVTGVGLHLGTAEEFVRKTGLLLPAGQDESEVRSALLPVVCICFEIQKPGCESTDLPGRACLRTKQV